MPPLQPDRPNEPFVGLMGASLGTGNRGVSALGASLVKLSSQALPSSQAVMLIGHRQAGAFEVSVQGATRIVPVVNYRMSPKSALRENLFWIAFLALAYRWIPIGPFRRFLTNHCLWLRTVQDAVAVGDIRGGDSFSDIYGLRGFLLASLPVATVLWVRGGILLFPQTYGPFKSALARRVAGYILRRADWIVARDRESVKTVEGLIGPTDRLRFCPDVAFTLDAIRPASPAIDPPLPERAGCLVGLNVNGLMYNGGYTRRNMFGLKMDYRVFLDRLVTALLTDESTHILLVPHTFAPPDNVESDPQACRDVRQAVPEAGRPRVHLVTAEYDQHEIKGVIGGCDFFIGSRMHSCIAALSQGIPTIGVAYSKKFKGVFESIGVADWVLDGRQSDTEGAIAAILQKLPHRAAMRTALSGKAIEAQKLLRETFALLLGSQPAGLIRPDPLK